MARNQSPKRNKKIEITGERATKIGQRALRLIASYRSNLETLQQSRQKTFGAYMQEPYGKEKAGRSQVVASDVSDTVESILPSLTRIFWGSKDVVNVSPVAGRGDSDKAKLMEHKLNFDIQNQNPGFLVLHDWFKDALFQKPGIVKYRWKRGKNKEYISFFGLNYFEYQDQLMRDDLQVESVERNPIPNIPASMVKLEQAFTYDITGWLIDEYSKPIFENVAPPDFIFDVQAKSIQASELTGERIRCHRNTLKKYGVDSDEVARQIANFSGKSDAYDSDAEWQGMLKDLGGANFVSVSGDDDDEFVYKYECYLNEYDDEGEPRPVKCLIFGDKVLNVEMNTYGKKPYCDLSSVRMPHRAVGRTAAELVEDIQKLKTTLLRYFMDNIYYQNGPTKVVNPFVVNLDDVYNNQVPEGVIRLTANVPADSAIKYTPVKPIAPQSFKIFELLDTVRENRVGVTRYNQGLDAASLNRTASGIAQVMNAAMARIEMIARIFAETGVRDLFQADCDMNLKFFDRKQLIRVNEDWVEISPSDISGKYDVSIDIGSGTGSKEMKVQQLTQMLNTYGMLIKLLAGVVAQHPDPVEKMKFIKMISADNIYNLIKAIWQNMGYKDIDKYWNDITKIGENDVAGFAGFGGAGGPGAALPFGNLLGGEGQGTEGNLAGLIQGIGNGAPQELGGQPVG